MSISHTLDLQPLILTGLQRALTCNAARFWRSVRQPQGTPGAMAGLCSSRARWPLAPNFCPQATRKSQIFHTNHKLGSLQFSLHHSLEWDQHDTEFCTRDLYFGVLISESAQQQEFIMSVIYFCPGFSCCPYYWDVCYSGVSARRELTLYMYGYCYNLALGIY